MKNFAHTKHEEKTLETMSSINSAHLGKMKMIFYKKMLYIGMFLLIIPQALSNVIVADHTMSRMIELTTKTPYCILHSDR